MQTHGMCVWAIPLLYCGAPRVKVIHLCVKVMILCVKYRIITEAIHDVFVVIPALLL